MENQVEIWKKHPKYVGIEVSTLGRVRTLDRVVSNEKMTRFTKGRILKQSNDKHGYLHVNISIDEKWVTKKVHRLVAQAFIPNLNNLPQINHKDNDRTNNNVSNLEWCSHSYNIQYREKFGKALNRPVFAINLTTLEISRFGSQHEASRALGVYQSSINKVINGTQKTAHGYLFLNDDGHAVDIVKSKLHEIGKTGLKI